jgi:hypothetical protein
MTREDFEFTLVKQYSDSIDELIVESESVYRSQIDYDLLDTGVKSILKAAKVDGLKEEIIWNILERKVPGYLLHVNGSKRNKKAA